MLLVWFLAVVICWTSSILELSRLLFAAFGDYRILQGDNTRLEQKENVDDYVEAKDGEEDPIVF